MSVVDRKMSDRELSRIGDIIKTLPVFSGFDETRLTEVSKTCGELLQNENSLDTILGVAAALPDKLHETAYALALEVAAADLHVEQEELRFLQLLRNKLQLDKLVVAALERGARARHQII
jgi:tellurite resistance protein